MPFFRVFPDQEYCYRRVVSIPASEVVQVEKRGGDLRREAIRLAGKHPAVAVGGWDTFDTRTIPELVKITFLNDGSCEAVVKAESIQCRSLIVEAKNEGHALDARVEGAFFPEEVEGWRFAWSKEPEMSSDIEDGDEATYRRCLGCSGETLSLI